MFNLKSSFFGEKSEDKAQNTALPNSFGKVRTLKEDLENFQSGKKEEEEVVTQGNPFSQNQQAPAAATLSSGSRTAPPFSPSASPSPPPSPPISSQSAAFSEKNPSMEPEKKNENPFPGSLGSSSYFERSPFENVKPVEESKPVEAAASPKSNSKTLIIVLSSVVAVALLGGGFYYWFVVRKPSAGSGVSMPPQNMSPVATPQAPEKKEPENKNLKILNIDSSAGSEGLKKGIETLASEFIASSSENIIEVNVLDTSSKAVKVKDFLTILSSDFPAALSDRFADNYTIFVFKDGSEARLGAVFELSKPEGMQEELTQQEKTLPLKFKLLYTNQAPSDTEVAFGSSQYNGANIRFANFPSLQNVSFDYSVVKGKQFSYFIVSTSKNTTRAILDYMAGK